MAVDNPLFWVLMATGAALAAAALVRYLRGSRRDEPALIGEHEVLVYLNESLVMDILRYRGDVTALKRRVEEYTRETAERRGEAKTRWFGFAGPRLREGAKSEDYDAEERPITAIRKVVRALEKAHVRVKITRGGLREQDVLPEGKAPFPARVLGKVEAWDERDGMLKMWALAIFR
ncbi:hypothetical protein [Amycolatopsis magusensis]|uniref:hypothetical protein n=1 Tax=Amycolatopsis magusensis TaxID=882444 RepID=UPI0037ACB606